MQKEKSICDNLLRSKERERSSFEQHNIKLKDETNMALERQNRMTN